MNIVLKIFLSMSFSGSLLILALLCGKWILKDNISRQWQYYIWLVVILRLLLPFSPETNLMGKTYQVLDQAALAGNSFQASDQAALAENSFQAPDQAITQDTPLSMPPHPGNALNNWVSAASSEAANGNAGIPSADAAAAHPLQDLAVLFHHTWLIWLAVAFGMLIRKATAYQGYIQYIRAGMAPVSDTAVLDRLSIIAAQAGIKKPVELCVNPLISSPLLIGFFHPCVVLPGMDISEQDFPYIALHELIHYKRRDLLYKWLVQVTVCLHWFNPFVHLMGQEIAKACEFSCDEAVLAKMGYDHAQAYGETLLDATAAVGKCKKTPGAITLNGNKKLLKERLCAIMKSKRMPKIRRLMMGALTLCMVLGASFVGVYSVAAASNQTADKPAAVRCLGKNSLLFPGFAERAYTDGKTAFFSPLADSMDEAGREDWPERALADSMDEAGREDWPEQALADGKQDFQSLLSDKSAQGNKSDRPEDKWEKEWEAAQTAEYQAAGIAMDGKNYYYQGQLVNVFMDIRANQAFYTLDRNPAGSVNIKIIRDTDDKIASVSYMTEAEAAELLEDRGDADDT